MRKLRRIVRSVINWLGYEIRSKDFDPEANFILPRHLLKLFELLKINCVIDVGANQGQYALMLRSFGYKGHIISIEPIRETYALLRKETENDKLWQAYSFALGAENSIKQFNVCKRSKFSSFLVTSVYSKKVYGQSPLLDHVEQVEMKRLDSVMDELVKEIASPHIILKMDTQGYDIEVLKGASGCIDRIMAIQTELSVLPLYESMPRYNDALLYLESLGFHITGFFTVIRDPASLRLIEMDCVMTRLQQNEGLNNSVGGRG
jgi:FkbM family methyltransferase